MEKGESYETYDDNIGKGDSSHLLEEYRPDMFQVSLGNIFGL